MKHVKDKLLRYLAGELPDDEVAELEAHLGRCDACAAAARSERELWNQLGGLAAMKPDRPSIWPGVAARTTATGSTSATASVRRLDLGWGLAGAALAAGLALGLLAPSGLLDSPDKLVELAATSEVESTGWLSDGTWLSGSDADDLDLVWLQVGLDEVGGGS